MKSLREMRREAREAIRGKWFWRIATVAILLNLIGYLANGFAGRIVHAPTLEDWALLAQHLSASAQQGAGLALPSPDTLSHLFGSSAFQLFIAYIFGAIGTLGLAAAVLNALANRESGWLRASFGGFRRPLSVAWLLFVINLAVTFWAGVLALPAFAVLIAKTGRLWLSAAAAAPLLLPGLVVMYRYRMAWFVLCDQPDATVRACLRESARLMKGRKMRAFLLDVSFVGWLLALGVLVGISVVSYALLARTLGMLGPFLASLVSLVAFYALLWFVTWFLTARGVFYREIRETGADAVEPQS